MNRTSRQFNIGNIKIGGGAPVSIQSMLNIPAENIEGNIAQAIELEKAGCEIIRSAMPDKSAAKLIYALKCAVKSPIVADIHFDYRLAIEAVFAGADKIRLNPGNITDKDGVRQVAKLCGERNIPIRIGVNSGSVAKEILAKYGGPTPEAMVESALKEAKLLEKYDFQNIVISIKSSDVKNTYEAYSLAAEQCDYPLHLGVTEAGTKRMGIIKSAAGIGGLLLKGIGDTIRVSLTDSPAEEVRAARDILRAVGLKKSGVTLISCPTCGRTKIDLIGLATEIEKRLENFDRSIKVAVMGCAVNGPGEAREADIGVAGGDNEGLIFRKGKIIRKVPQELIIEELMKEIENIGD